MICCSFNGLWWFLIWSIYTVQKLVNLNEYINDKLSRRKFFAYLSDHRLNLFFNAIIDFMMKFFFRYLLLLERTFGWVLFPSPCLFLFALHLEWPLNTSIDKKSNAIFIFANKLVFPSSLWFKYLQLGKKLTCKKLNVDRQFFKNVICIFGCYSV